MKTLHGGEFAVLGGKVHNDRHADGTIRPTLHRPPPFKAVPGAVTAPLPSSMISTRRTVPRPAWLAALSIALLLAVIPASARAQIGGSTDILVGTITGPGGSPLQGAQVQATSVETGITRSKTTNDKGQFTLLFPDGGGEYTVTVRYLGMAPRTVQVSRIADEDRLVVDLELTAVPTQLGAVTVVASPRPNAADERPTPGSTGRTLSGDQLARLPIDPSDPNAIALLAPGVVAVGETDSTAAGFSVAGQSPEQNLVTLDGLTFESGTVPQEAVRSTRVVTNTYDVARGQFTGGMVQTTTRGGTNDVAGSVNYSLRDPRLQWGDEAEAGGFAQGFTQHQLSGGLGGPLARDRLFIFGSGQLRRRVNPLQTLTGADALTLQRLGMSPDSAARFLELLQGYGLPSTVTAMPDEELSDRYSGIVRLDWVATENHSLMVRGSMQRSLQEAFRTRALAVPAYGGEQDSDGFGAMVTLSSVLGRFLNEVRAGVSRDDRSGIPYLELPEGRVRVRSALEDGTTGVTVLDFGGNPALPTAGDNTQVDFTNELSLLGIGGHRFKLGTLVNYTAFSTATSTNAFGSFTYNSLDAFARNEPAVFTRTLSAREREGSALAAALYLGDTWRRSRALQLTYGLRLEHDRYLVRPAYNAEVESLFGRRTDALPVEWHLSPRIGFSWTIGLPEQGEVAAAAGGGRGARGGGGGGGRAGRGGSGGDFGPGRANVTVVRGGIGEFRGRTPTALFASAIDATGLPEGERQLVCIGEAVPAPDWAAYFSDPDAIPSTCADGGAGSPVSRGAPNVALLADAFGAPRAWRASLGVQRRLSQRLGFNLEGSYAFGTNLTGARDLNLRTTPAFTLADEAGRPVYSPAASIVPATGQSSVLASRQHAQYAQVVEAMSELRSHAAQVTARVNGTAVRGLMWNLAYTWTRARDQTAFAPGAGFRGASAGRGFGAFGFGVGSATTGGDPNAVEWGTSDVERRHAVSGSLNWFARPWLDVTSVLRLTSGQPFSPRVGGDINGDGSRNDRAFVFDPATTTDSVLAAGMTSLLADAPDRARACLTSQLGTIAGRNSCRAGWSPSLDLQFNVRPDLGGRVGRRVQLLVSVINPLAGADRLLHGPDDLRGWGQPDRPDATLLHVRGFDPVAGRYLYEVNERFGDTQSSRVAIRNPFQLGVQLRVQLGPDRQRDRLMGALGRRPQGGNRPIDARSVLDRVAPDPVAPILALRDSLQLTGMQVAALDSIATSLRARIDSLVLVVEQDVAGLPAGTDMRAAFPTLQPRLQAGREAYLAAIARARGVLTPRQWEQLPEAIRSPALPRVPGGGRRGVDPAPAAPPAGPR